MNVKPMLLAAFVIAAASCHKTHTPAPPPDTNKIRLKDMNERHLPSPYYHFDYNASGVVTHASFSSGLGTYNVFYNDKKITRMENQNLNNPRHEVRTGDGVNYEIDYTYSYDAAGRPIIKTGNLLWTKGPDTGKRFETQSTFSYYD